MFRALEADAPFGFDVTDPERPLRGAIGVGRGRSRGTRGRMSDAHDEMAPGDEAPPGTPGTGEDVCPRCNGSGQADGGTCPECEGTGTVIKGVGGA